MNQKSVVALVVLATFLSILSACGTEDQSVAVDNEIESATSPDESADDHGDENPDNDQAHADDDNEADHDDEKHDGDEEHDDHEEHDDEAGAGLDAHEHGVAELSVAWSGSDMIIDLITPTQNIFGFEYEPTTDEDLAVVADRTEVLSAPGVLTINADAGCELVDNVSTDVEFEGSHAELTASWFFTCENPAEIAQLDTAALFAEFPNLEEIEAQWASGTGQSSAELSPSATMLALE